MQCLQWKWKRKKYALIHTMKNCTKQHAAIDFDRKNRNQREPFLLSIKPKFYPGNITGIDKAIEWTRVELTYVQIVRCNEITWKHNLYQCISACYVEPACKTSTEKFKKSVARKTRNAKYSKTSYNRRRKVNFHLL